MPYRNSPGDAEIAGGFIDGTEERSSRSAITAVPVEVQLQELVSPAQLLESRPTPSLIPTSDSSPRYSAGSNRASKTQEQLTLEWT